MSVNVIYDIKYNGKAKKCNEFPVKGEFTVIKNTKGCEKNGCYRNIILTSETITNFSVRYNPTGQNVTSFDRVVTAIISHEGKDVGYAYFTQMNGECYGCDTQYGTALTFDCQSEVDKCATSVTVSNVKVYGTYTCTDGSTGETSTTLKQNEYTVSTFKENESNEAIERTITVNSSSYGASGSKKITQKAGPCTECSCVINSISVSPTSYTFTSLTETKEFTVTLSTNNCDSCSSTYSVYKGNKLIKSNIKSSEKFEIQNDDGEYTIKSDDNNNKKATLILTKFGCDSRFDYTNATLSFDALDMGNCSSTSVISNIKLSNVKQINSDCTEKTGLTQNITSSSDYTVSYNPSGANETNSARTVNVTLTTSSEYGSKSKTVQVTQKAGPCTDNVEQVVVYEIEVNGENEIAACDTSLSLLIKGRNKICDKHSDGTIDNCALPSKWVNLNSDEFEISYNKAPSVNQTNESFEYIVTVVGKGDYSGITKEFKSTQLAGPCCSVGTVIDYLKYYVIYDDTVVGCNEEPSREHITVQADIKETITNDNCDVTTNNLNKQDITNYTISYNPSGENKTNKERTVIATVSHNNKEIGNFEFIQNSGSTCYSCVNTFSNITFDCNDIEKCDTSVVVSNVFANGTYTCTDGSTGETSIELSNSDYNVTTNKVVSANDTESPIKYIVEVVGLGEYKDIKGTKEITQNAGPCHIFKCTYDTSSTIISNTGSTYLPQSFLSLKNDEFCPITVSEDYDWVNVSLIEGSESYGGNVIANMTFYENTNPTERTCTLKFKQNSSGKELSYTFKQEAAKSYIFKFADINDLTYIKEIESYETNEISIEVLSLLNGLCFNDVTVESADNSSWVKNISLSDDCNENGNKVLKFNLEQNTSEISRSETLILTQKQDEGSEIIRLVINQKGDTGYFIATYDITDTNSKTELFDSGFTISQIKRMLIDSIVVEPTNEYTFNTIGTHTIKCYTSEDFTSAKKMFYTTFDLQTIDFTKCDLNNLTTTECMIYSCFKLTSIKFPLSSFGSKIENINEMFKQTSAITSIDLSNFDSTSVKTANSAFTSCYSLETIKLSNNFCEHSESMNSMFYDCKSLVNVDVSKIKTDNSKNIGCMLYGCESFTNLNLTAWNVSNVEDMSNLCHKCTNLKNINISNWNTSNVTNMSGLLRKCNSLTSVTKTDLNTSKVTNMYAIFEGCSSLTYVDVSEFDMSSCTNMGSMFETCETINNIDVSKWDTSSCEDISYIFLKCKALTSINVSNWDMSSCKSFSYSFYYCENLTNLNVSNWDTSSCTLMEYTFYGCTKLSVLDVSKWNTSKVTNIRCMFAYCSNVLILDVSKWDTSKVNDMYFTFILCQKLTTIDVSKWVTSACTNMEQMFQHCNSVTSLNVSNFDTSKVKIMKGMFSYCYSLTSLDLSSFEFVNNVNITNMFWSCQNLSSIIINSDCSDVGEYKNMFSSESITENGTFKVPSTYRSNWERLLVTNRSTSNFPDSWIITS